MKHAVAAILAAVSLVAGAASLTETFDAEAARLDAQVAAGKMSETTHAKAMAQLARDLFPNDAGLIQLREFKAGLAARFDSGEITKDQYESRWAARRDAYYGQRDAGRAAVQAHTSSQQGINGAAALGVAAESFNRSRAVPTTSCRTAVVGGSNYTTCQ